MLGSAAHTTINAAIIIPMYNTLWTIHICIKYSFFLANYVILGCLFFFLI